MVVQTFLKEYMDKKKSNIQERDLHKFLVQEVLDNGAEYELVKESSKYPSDMQAQINVDLLNALRSCEKDIWAFMERDVTLLLTKNLLRIKKEGAILPYLHQYADKLFENETKFTNMHKAEYNTSDNNIVEDYDGYSDYLYWEAVHEGDINPDDERDYIINDYDYDYDYDIGYEDKYSVLRKYLSIILRSEEIPLKEQTKIFNKVSGYWENKIDYMANLYFLKSTKILFEKHATKHNYKVVEHREHVTLTNQEGQRLLRLYWLSNIGDLYKYKSVKFYDLNCNKLVDDHYVKFALEVMDLFEFPIDKPVVDFIKTYLIEKDVNEFLGIKNMNYLNMQLERRRTDQGLQISFNLVDLTYKLGNHYSASGNGSFKSILHIKNKTLN